MFQVNNTLSLCRAVHIKCILVFALLLFLSSCGDSCYDEVSIGDDGSGYTEKTYTHALEATKEVWTDTGINLTTTNNTFTISNIEGSVSCTKGVNFPGQCNMSYTTMCEKGNKYICNDTNCSSKTLVNSCSGKSNCTRHDSCAAAPGSAVPPKTMCKSGFFYVYDKNGNPVKTTNSCKENVFCDAGTKKMKFPYSDGNDSQYSYIERNIGTCSTSDENCAIGHPYPVPSTRDSWTEIFSIYPDDDIYLKILQPNTSSGAVMPTTSPGNASMNAYSVNKDFKPSGGSCPSSVLLNLAQSSYNQCSSLDNGYYTCPMCEGIGRNLGLGDAVYKSCDGTKPLTCWLVGGAGLWLKIIDNSEDCDASPSCSNGDQNCVWFNANTDANSQFGVVTYQPQGSVNTGDDCVNDYSKCNNRITTRHITGKNGQISKVCVKIADVNGLYGDNTGGYTVYATRRPCVGVDGRPSESAVEFSTNKGLMALEYIVSSTEPSPQQYGTHLTSDVVYPSKITTSGDGRLYIRVQDTNWVDNSGSLNVTIKYKSYPVNGTISEFIETVKNSLKSMTLQASTQLFRNITCTGSYCNCMGPSCGSQYIDYIRILLIFYIASYGFMFIMGSVEISQMDLMIRVFKIGVVLAVTSDNSFNFFHNNFFDLFWGGVDELISKSQSGFDNTSYAGNVFSFADNMISLTLLSKTTWLKLSAMLFISPMGMILAILLIIGVLIFLLGLFKAIVMYLMATLVIGILVLLAPIFIPFMLFKPTQHLFENWIKMFAQYSLEPILLLIGLGMLTQLAYVLFTSIIDFHVCWKCMWPINFAPWASVTSAMSLTDTLFCLQWFGPFGLMPDGGGGALAGLGIGAVEVLLFVIIGHLMFGYDTLVQQIVKRISGGHGAKFRSSSGREFSSAGNAALQQTGLPSLASAAGAGIKSTARRAARRVFSPRSEEDKLLKAAKEADVAHKAGIKGDVAGTADGLKAAKDRLKTEKEDRLKTEKEDVKKGTKTIFDTHRNPLFDLHDIKISDKAKSLSSSMSEELQKGSTAEMEKLKDPSLPETERENIAKDMGENIYKGVGETEEFQGFINNLDRLSNVEVGSEIHSKLSPEALELHKVLLEDKDNEKILSVLKNSDASVEERAKAMGELSAKLYKNTENAHKILYDPESGVDRDALIEEVSKLEKELPDTFRRDIPKE